MFVMVVIYSAMTACEVTLIASRRFRYGFKELSHEGVTLTRKECVLSQTRAEWGTMGKRGGTERLSLIEGQNGCDFLGKKCSNSVNNECWIWACPKSPQREHGRTSAPTAKSTHSKQALD